MNRLPIASIVLRATIGFVGVVGGLLPIILMPFGVFQIAPFGYAWIVIGPIVAWRGAVRLSRVRRDFVDYSNTRFRD